MKKRYILLTGCIAGIVIGILNRDKILDKINEIKLDCDDLSLSDIDMQFEAEHTGIAPYEKVFDIFKTPGKRISFNHDTKEFDVLLETAKQVNSKNEGLNKNNSMNEGSV